jgi:dTDP-4-amino-4,6-dideoxygalactose transaminase
MKKINFIENKYINFKNLNKIYNISWHSNHHANFGPVSKQLENFLAKKIKLPKNKKVIFCSSATMAILTIAKFLISKKKNRFATSNFSFFSNYIDDLKNSLILASNENCSIDINVIKRNIKYFDNLIITNAFNFNPDYSKIYELCNKNKKQLIIDNALTLYERPKDYETMDVFETISFHHTKPWGIGEGGAIICNKKYEYELKNLINFGSKNFYKNHKYGINAKISDLSCAAQLDRLKLIDTWGKEYHTQANRVIEIVKKNFNIEKIFYNDYKTPKNYIPILFKKKIEEMKLNNSRYLEFRKYYKPLLKKTIKNCHAKKIYERILCVPSHSDVKKLTDKQIIKDITFITC